MDLLRIKYWGFLLVVFLATTSTAKAQEFVRSLRNDNSPVIKHEGGRGIAFPKRSKTERYAEVAQVYTLRKPELDEDPTGPKISASGSLPDIQTCKNSRSRRVQVAHFSKGTSELDYLFYNADDYLQVDKARSYLGSKVAYSKGSELDMSDPIPYSKQVLALSYGVECLPTRFHFISDNNSRYIEYLEGELAWGQK
jgi:hypothetical protein